MLNIDWNIDLKRLFVRATKWDKVNIMNLPNDIIVDNIFSLLKVEELCAFRRVNQTFYVLSHHPTIWLRYLRELNLGVPPVPPTERYKGRNIAEEMVIRSISLDANWRGKGGKTTCIFNIQECNPHANVLSMAILPGGKYMVASVRDGPEGPDAEHHLLVFVMDHPQRGAIPLAKTRVRTKAYNIDAKYMSHKGEKGIMITYLRREIHDRQTRLEKNIDVNAFSDNYGIDPPVPLRYESTTLHITLSSLDTLNQPHMSPGTAAWVAFANTLAPPFQQISRLRSGPMLHSPTLQGVGDTSYLAVIRNVDGNDEILFSDLATGNTATVQPKLWHPADWENVIPNLDTPGVCMSLYTVRILPGQRQFLAVMQCELATDLVAPHLVAEGRPPVEFRYPMHSKYVRHAYCVALYDLPPITSPKEVLKDIEPVQIWICNNQKITGFKVSENYQPVANDTSSYKGLPFINTQPPPPISIYVETYEPQPGVKHGMSHLCLFARRNAVSTSGWAYDLGDIRQEARFDAHKHDTVCVLPGAVRALIYTHHENDRSANPRIMELRRYNNCETIGATIPEQIQTQTMMRRREPLPRELFQTLEVPLRLKEQLQKDGLAAIAFDEAIGRVCIVARGEETIHILDFAQMPTVPAQFHDLEHIVNYGDPEIYPQRPNPLVPFHRSSLGKRRPVRGQRVVSDSEDDFDDRDDPMEPPSKRRRRSPDSGYGTEEAMEV